MSDSKLLGLRDPVTGERLLCSILGGLRTVFALLVFRRDTGRRWILNMVLNDDDSDEFQDLDKGLDQDCVKVEFTPKSELTKEDRAVLATAGFTPSVKRGPVWPAFRSLVPGGYPWYLTPAEADTLLFVLPRVAAFATLCRNLPELGENLASDGVPFLPADFDPASRSLRIEDLDWQPPIPPPELPPPLAMLPEATLVSLLRLPQAPGFHLEMDLFYAPMAVSGEERPYFPKTAMAVDRETNLIGGLRMAESNDPEAVAAVGEVLASTLQMMARRPEAIHVQRPRLMQMLAPLAAQLGISVKRDERLPALSEACAAVMQRF